MDYLMRPAPPTLAERLIDELATGDATRAQLISRLGVSRTSLARALEELRLDGPVVSALVSKSSGQGRPGEKLHFNSTVGYSVGVDITRSRGTGVVLNRRHEELARVSCPREDGDDELSLFDTVANRLLAAGQERGYNFREASKVGIGVPMPLDYDSPDFRKRGERLKRFAQQFWSASVLLENSVRLGAIGESGWGNSCGVANHTYVRLGPGIGCATVLSDQITGGRAGYTGELGHISVPGETTPCFCGKTGCLETVASTAATCQAAGVDDLTQLGSEYREGNPQVISTVNQVSHLIGRFLGIVALLTNPQTIVCAGELVEEIPEIVGFISVGLDQTLLPAMRGRITVTKSSLGSFGSALGAARAADFAIPVDEFEFDDVYEWRRS